MIFEKTDYWSRGQNMVRNEDMFSFPVSIRYLSTSVFHFFRPLLPSQVHAVEDNRKDLQSHEPPESFPGRFPILIPWSPGCHEPLNCGIQKLYSVYISVRIVVLTIELCLELLTDGSSSLNSIPFGRGDINGLRSVHYVVFTVTVCVDVLLCLPQLFFQQRAVTASPMKRWQLLYYFRWSFLPSLFPPLTSGDEWSESTSPTTVSCWWQLVFWHFFPSVTDWEEGIMIVLSQASL